ncbi:elongation factor P--(R)-beta-lysine ligase [bacterium]|nr:elongation factor P--(R)-beta-lysine ligase [bacterium]
MTDWKPGASVDTLHQRSSLLTKIRTFFKNRNVLEVETPSISQYPTIDLHLESFSVNTNESERLRYLITSPEYHMKRLISAGSGSIFQICKAFRCDETGRNHNPEFTILEWYRVGWDHWRLMSEIELLLDLLLNSGPADYLSYCDAFQQFLDINPLLISQEQFLSICGKHGLLPPACLESESVARDEWLNYLMGFLIEPNLGKEHPVFIYDYPATQANLARIHEDNPSLALRFEVYYRGIELGNGFYELTDAKAQEKRFKDENQIRIRSGKEGLPIDNLFLSALEKGMPECSGVAMGVDRIIMLALGKTSIEEVITFNWPKS